MRITIPEPCHEKWLEMSPKEKGRHCAKCDKVVVDFTQKSDLEIKQYFYDNSNFCGRFHQPQLNRQLTHNHSAWKFGALAFSYLFLNNYVSAQHVLPSASDSTIKLNAIHPSVFNQYPGHSFHQAAYRRKGKSNVIELRAGESLLKSNGVKRIIIETGAFQIPLDTLSKNIHYITIPKGVEWDSFTVLLWGEGNKEIGRIGMRAKDLYISEANVNKVTLAKGSKWYFAMPVAIPMPPIVQGIPPYEPWRFYDSNSFQIPSSFLWGFTTCVYTDTSKKNKEPKDSSKMQLGIEGAEQGSRVPTIVNEEIIKQRSKTWVWLLVAALLTLIGFLLFKKRGKKNG